MKATIAAPLLLTATALAGCDAHRPWPGLEPSLERMMVQPHAAAYQASSVFSNGQVMRPLPAGARPYQPPDARALASKLEPEELDRLDRIPIAMTRETLAHGREEFTVICATCHGVLGDGDSAVADRMALRRPPSLHEARIRGYPAGHLYRVIGEGFGLMPSYAMELPEPDRWAVVAYVRALQLSFDAEIARLPPDIRAEAERQLL